jgi:D-serine deaminase-like pyridoxal phosphate-dependent protein
MKLEDLCTPALVLDAAVVEKNVHRLANYVKSHGLGLRPHTKTHKSRKLSAMQLATGSIGLTVAKVGEAQTMLPLEADMLLAYPALDSHRAAWAAKLAKQTTLRVAIDSALAAERLSAAASAEGSTLGILVDLDVGMGRTGVATPELLWQLAEVVLRSPGLRLDGIFCYPGHVWGPADQQAQQLAPVSQKLAAAIDLFAKHGVQAGIVSGGSTPTAYQSHHVPQYTEIRPGTYVYNDMNTVAGNFCTLDDCAARMVCTVISNAVAGQVVLDSGTKVLTSDRCIPNLELGHGLIVEYPAARITKLSEEHGQVDITNCDRVPKLGERVTVIPNHICPCINLASQVWWHEAGEITPLPIDARGEVV